ncbi:MAG: sulfatase [Opitutales bacterium]
MTTDQQRWDFFDNRTVPSLEVPNLRRLANEGATLSRTYTNCPVCIPTRFTWMHGLYASQGAYRLGRNSHSWPTRFPTWAQGLQRKGYHTALFGKLHSHAWLDYHDLRDTETETRLRGFETVFETSGRTLMQHWDCHWTQHLRDLGLLEKQREETRRRNPLGGGHESYEPGILERKDTVDGFVTEHACRWLRDYDEPRPFAMHLSFCAPHFVMDPPEAYLRKYPWENMPAPAGVQDPERIDMWKKETALYCALIDQIDDEVGRVLDLLEEKGILDDTLVLFTTDHGDMMGHKNRRHKVRPEDTSARTPVLARCPGRIPAGVELEDLAESADLPLTLLQAGGWEEPEAWLTEAPGRSYWDYLCGRTDHHRQWAFSEMSGAWRMTVERDWKYVANRTGGDELYDLKHDPWELENRIADPDCAPHRERLMRRLIESMTNIAPPNHDGRQGSTYHEHRDDRNRGMAERAEL